jgi:hypothetical protein
VGSLYFEETDRVAAHTEIFSKNLARSQESWFDCDPSGEVQVPPEAIDRREAFLMEKFFVPACAE